MKWCCVPNCRSGKNSKYLIHLKFYFFPKAVDEESASRRKKWIKAINKINPDGSPWEPRQYTQICSQHFVNNDVSDDPDSPSYLPTLYLSETVVVAFNHVKPKNIITNSLTLTTTTASSSSSQTTSATFSPKKLRHHSSSSLALTSSSQQNVDTQQPLTATYIEDYNQTSNRFISFDKERTMIALQTSANINRMKPTARWGHTMTVMQDQMVLLVGGQGDRDIINRDSLWKLDLAEAKWSMMELSNCNRLDSRMGHVCVYEPVLRYLYMHGGTRKSRWFNDVHAYDVDANKWCLVTTSGVQAPKLSYHSCVTFNYQLWFFGGTKPLSPSSSSSASLSTISGVQEECTDDVYVFECLDKRWQKVLVQGKVQPRKRSGHSGTVISNKMVIFGGWDNPTCFNDVFMLDLIACEWIQPEISGQPPSPRSWHSSCALSTDQIAIHGGFNSQYVLDDLFVLNVDLLVWTRLHLQPKLPKRSGHTLISLPYHHENGKFHQILAFGGGDNDGGFYSDLINIMVPFV